MSVSASALARVMACPASAVLPAMGSTSDAAERGVSIHAFVRRVLSGVPREEAIQHVASEYRATCEGIDFATITNGHRGIATEVAYALHAGTGEVRMLGHNIGRSYPADLTLPWILGTADMVAIRADGVPVVEDLKTGQPVDPASENAQLKFYALCLRGMTGADKVEGRIRYVREDGRTFVDAHEFDMFELDDFAVELRRTVAAVTKLAAAYAERGDVGGVHSGSHCRYCPAVTSCPAKTGLARSMLPWLTDVAARVRAMTPVERGQVWVKAKEAQAILDVITDGLRDCAIVEPTPLPDGKVLTVIQSSRTSFSQSDAVSLLRSLGASQEQLDALYKRSSFDVVKAIKPKKDKAA